MILHRLRKQENVLCVSRPACFSLLSFSGTGDQLCASYLLPLCLCTSYLCASLKSMVNTPCDTPVLVTHGPSSGPSSQSCLCQPSPQELASWLPLPWAPCSGSGSLHSPCHPLCQKLFLLQAGFQTNPYSEPPPFGL